MGWEYVVVLIISIIVQIALAPRPSVPTPATFSDFDFPQYEEGTPQAVIFGDCRLRGWMVLRFGEFGVYPIQKKGGKK